MSEVQALSITSVYKMDTDEQLMHTHDSMLMLIETKHELSNKPEFTQHRRALVNEMHARCIPYSPKLTQ